MAAELVRDTPAPGWAVTRIRGRYNISHPWMATTPGCPLGPHPTRNCHCKPHRTAQAAITYTHEQEDQA